MPHLLRSVVLLLMLLVCAESLHATEPDPEVKQSLETLHAAFESYRKDHEGEYPPLQQINANGERELWVDLIKPYLSDSSDFGKVEISGPFFTVYTPMSERRNGSATTISFGYNRFGLGRDGGGKEEGVRYPVRDVPDPENTILLVEVDSPKQAGAGWYAAWCDRAFDFARFGGKAHVLFASGRVAVLSPAELLVDENPSTALAPWYGDLSKKP